MRWVEIELHGQRNTANDVVMNVGLSQFVDVQFE